MTVDTVKTLDETERAQADLRECIEQARELAGKSAELIKRHRRIVREGS